MKELTLISRARTNGDNVTNLGLKSLDTRSCENCKQILDELEKIDGEADKYGVEFVKNSERAAAKKHGITKFPSLVYFRHKEPTLFEGQLHLV